MKRILLSNLPKARQKRFIAVQSRPMNLAIAQLNPTVGDIRSNTALVIHAIDKARAEGADLLVTPEMVIIGYPPRDLLFRNGVVEACENAVNQIADHAGDMHVIVGHPRICCDGEKPFYNSASVCTNGKVIAVYDKRLFPGYDVFDEDRYFQSGKNSCVVDIAGKRIGLLICEDFWRAQDALAERSYEIEPVKETVDAGCDMLISLNATPFVIGKCEKRVELLRSCARSIGKMIVAVHQVGANDDLIFDGRSVVVGSDGEITDLLPAWESCVKRVEITGKTISVKSDPMHELFNALVLGVRDYCHKTGNKRVVLGLSGGIDSAVVASIAAAALGSRNVTGVLMPSRYSSAGSVDDARALEANLSLAKCPQLPIESVHHAIEEVIKEHLHDQAAGITDENVQSRVRGILLMAFSNASNGLVLATGNKSEIATGYTTLYGDMCGALFVIGDVVKTRVFELARWMNENYKECGFEKPPIPDGSITKPPSAELRPNQTDQDTLPEYEVLDEIVQRFIEQEESADQIAALPHLDTDLVMKTTRMIDLAQYKRDQAAIVLKVTPRAFGRGRPMPVVMNDTK